MIDPESGARCAIRESGHSGAERYLWTVSVFGYHQWAAGRTGEPEKAHSKTEAHWRITRRPGARASGHLVLNIDNQSASTPNAVTQTWLNDLNISVGVIGGIAALLGGIGGVVQAVTPAAAAAAAGDGVELAAVGADAGLAAAAANIVAQNVNQGANLAARVATFMRIAAFVTLGGAVAAMPAIVTSILTAIATGEYSSVPKVADLTNAAVGKVVTWPASVGSYFLNTAQLNGALIFVLA
jgi:hypothetical protein